MPPGSFVAYYRVSTDKQGRSGLGLEAQQRAVIDYLNGGNWKLIAEVTEIESGRKSDRPKLEEARRLCRLHGATLIIAKLDRLSRDAHFLLGLQKAGVDFIAVDMPSANKLTVGIMALVAEDEAKRISDRTKAALAAAKARGIKLGGNRGVELTNAAREAGRAVRATKANQWALETVGPTILELEGQGIMSLGALAKTLNDRGIPTARGGKWTATQVMRIKVRIKAAR